MKYEWDVAKALRNRLKHGVSFADAVIALSDERAVTMEDGLSKDESRFVAIGLDAQLCLLVVVFTYQEDVVRMLPIVMSRSYRRLIGSPPTGVGRNAASLAVCARVDARALGRQDPGQCRGSAPRARSAPERLSEARKAHPWALRLSGCAGVPGEDHAAEGDGRRG